MLTVRVRGTQSCRGKGFQFGGTFSAFHLLIFFLRLKDLESEVCLSSLSWILTNSSLNMNFYKQLRHLDCLFEVPPTETFPNITGLCGSAKAPKPWRPLVSRQLRTSPSFASAALQTLLRKAESFHSPVQQRKCPGLVFRK